MPKANLIDGIADDEGYPFFGRNPASLNGQGRDVAVVYELTQGVDDRILDTVDSLIEGGHLDAAVREASIRLEHTLRRLVSDENLRGAKLVDKIFENTQGTLALPNALRLQLKAEFLRFFAYVRNEYAHNIAPVDVLAASRALRRCSRLMRISDALRIKSR